MKQTARPTKRRSLFGIAMFSLLALISVNHVLHAQASTADQPAQPGEAVAVFAGGCFWCVESDFDHVPGVLRTISGYTGGALADATYNAVSRGGTGHREAVQIVFDETLVSYEQLLEIFWRSVDPTDDGGQFCDRGEAYLTGIFATDADQLRAAEKSKLELEASNVLSEPIVTPIALAGEFYPAENYHQGYYEKNPVRYKFYRFSCGRDARVEAIWGEQAYQGIN